MPQRLPTSRISRAAVFCLVLGASFVLSPGWSSSGESPRPTAPRFSLPVRSGGTVTLESLKAKVVLVDFWASWCGPCRKSFPWMTSLQERYGKKGLAIVAINLDKDRSAAESFLVKYPASFAVAFDPAGKTAEAYKVTAMPSTYLVGSDGTILASHLGFDPRQTGEIETRIEEACIR